MAYIMHKKISGKTYYYAEQRIWKDGKSRREWQKYLGTIDSIIDAVEGKPCVPYHAVLFEFGGVASYLSLAKEIKMVENIDRMLPKRDQGQKDGMLVAIEPLDRSENQSPRLILYNHAIDEGADDQEGQGRKHQFVTGPVT